MCATNGGHGACCPPGQIIKEKICGNFNGPGGPLVWRRSGAPVSYVAGTFEIFNSNSSIGTVTTTGTANPTIILSAATGNSDSISVTNPSSFIIELGQVIAGHIALPYTHVF
jgi:hypothetical protein